MAGELLHVGDDEGLRPLPGSAADALPEGDAQAGDRALEGAEDEHIPADAVEARPEEAHPFLQERRRLRHPGDRIVLPFQQMQKVLIQAEIGEGLQGDMAVAVRLFIQILLVVFLRRIEAFERKELHFQRLSQPFGRRTEDVGDDGPVGEIRVVHACPVARAHILPLPVDAERIDERQETFRQEAEGHPRGVIDDAHSLRMAGCVGIDLLVGRCRDMPVGISRHSLNDTFDAAEEVFRPPEAAAGEINLLQHVTSLRSPRRAPFPRRRRAGPCTFRHRPSSRGRRRHSRRKRPSADGP